jgi:hypothetical protein
LNSISRTAENPISAPPMVEAIGVKGVMTDIRLCNADPRRPLNG